MDSRVEGFGIVNISDSQRGEVIKELKRVSLFDSTKKRILELIETSSIRVLGTSERGLEIIADDIKEFLKQFNIGIISIISDGRENPHKKFELQISLLLGVSKETREETSQKSDTSTSNRESTVVNKVASLFEARKGELLSLEEIASTTGASLMTVKISLSDIGKALQELGDTKFLLRNIRGNGYVYGTREEIFQIYNEIFPPKRKAETGKKTPKQVEETKKYRVTAIEKVTSLFEEKKGELLTKEFILSKTNLSFATIKSIIYQIQQTLEDYSQENYRLVCIHRKGFIYGTKEQVENFFPPKKEKKRRERVEITSDIKKSQQNPQNEEVLPIYKLAELFEQNQGKLLSKGKLCSSIGGRELSLNILLRELRNALESVGSEKKIENIRGKGYIYGTSEQIEQILKSFQKPIKEEFTLHHQSGNITPKQQIRDLEKAGRGRGVIVKGGYISETPMDSSIKNLLDGINHIKGSFKFYSKDFIRGYKIDFQSFIIDGVQLENDEFCLITLLLRLQKASIINIKNYLSVPNIEEKLLVQYLIFVKAGIHNKFHGKFQIEVTKQGDYRLVIKSVKSTKEEIKKSPIQRGNKNIQGGIGKKRVQILSYIITKIEKGEKVFVDTLKSKFGIKQSTLGVYIVLLNKALTEKSTGFRLEFKKGELLLVKNSFGEEENNTSKENILDSNRGKDGSGTTGKGIKKEETPVERDISEKSFGGGNLSSSKIKPREKTSPLALHLNRELITFGLQESDFTSLSSKGEDIIFDEKTFTINKIQVTDQEFYLYVYLFLHRGKEISIDELITNFGKEGFSQTDILLLKSSINNKFGNISPFSIQLDKKMLRIPILKKDAREFIPSILEYDIEIYQEQRIIVFIGRDGKRYEIFGLSQESFNIFYKIITSPDISIKWGNGMEVLYATINSVLDKSRTGLTLKKNTHQKTLRLGRIGDDSSEMAQNLISVIERSISQKKEIILDEIIQKSEDKKSNFDFTPENNEVSYLSETGEFYNFSGMSDTQFLILSVLSLNKGIHISLKKLSLLFHQEFSSVHGNFYRGNITKINEILYTAGLPFEIKKEGKEDFVFLEKDIKKEIFRSDKGEFTFTELGNKEYSLSWSEKIVTISDKLYGYISRLLRKYEESGETSFQVNIKGHPERVINPVKTEIESCGLPFSFGYDGYFSFK